MFVADPFTTQANEHDEDAKRVMKAIENGEYCLLCQLIAPAIPDLTEAEHYEILVRLKENEKNLIVARGILSACRDEWPHVAFGSMGCGTHYRMGIPPPEFLIRRKTK